MTARKRGAEALAKVYIGIGPETGEKIEEEEAFDYALKRCLFGALRDKQEFREMLVEWFYSGNWLEKELEEA